MKAIDLYAGVGGWAVGFELAGLVISDSYEWWKPAADTHENNSPSPVHLVDIRKLEMEELPTDVDIVIGSPPCTQFSYSNRGGSGDIADGLIDIAKFLDVVSYLKPRFWAFENVPRVQKVLDAELTIDGQLSKYRHIFHNAHYEVFDMAEYGVPQRRKRCIAGNFDFKLLRSYSSISASPTLGDVVSSLAKGKDPIFDTDPNIGVTKEKNNFVITDNEPEAPLNWEEERFNREMKVSHPIYNGMPFPDPMERTSRTVTATCTRVSRESLIISDPKTGAYRRLSVRERASLQSFPVSFQFLGKTHSEKLKMIGNAIPPAFTYLVAEAMKETSLDELKLPRNLKPNEFCLSKKTITTQPDKAGRSYPVTRRFRFSVPNLRFKSGTRFELANVDGVHRWRMSFYFGDSKRVNRKDFSETDILQIKAKDETRFLDYVDELKLYVNKELTDVSQSALQDSWSHRGDGIHPFILVDRIAKVVGAEVNSNFIENFGEDFIEHAVRQLIYGSQMDGIGRQKILLNSKAIFVGALVSAFVNSHLEVNT